MRKLVSEAYLAGITCEAFEVERESVQTAKKLFEVVPPFFHELFGHCSKTGRRQQILKVRKYQKIFKPEVPAIGLLYPPLSTTFHFCLTVGSKLGPKSQFQYITNN